MACLIPKNWPVQYNDDEAENGNEAEYKKDNLAHLIVKESKDARLNVVVCFLINLIVQVHLSFVDIAIGDEDLLETLDVNTTEANTANNIYKSMTNVYAPVALYLMSKSSYKTTVLVGSLFIGVAFTNISFLNKGPEGVISWYWQVWLCGPVALGVSCLKLGAIIPVLEYYKRDRMKALVITRIGTVLGAAATIGIMFAENLSWRTLFRINAGLCVPSLAIAFILKDIVITEKMREENDRNKRTDENEEEEEERTVCSDVLKEFIKNTFRVPVLKDKKFWITVIVFFFFSAGTSLPTLSLPSISKQMQEELAPPVESFYEVLSSNVGTLLGLILTYLLKSLPCVQRYRERKKNMGFVFSIITLSGYVMGILSIVTQESSTYYIVYILVLTIFEVLTENFRDESMPTAFGRFSIRLTQGFLQMSVGIGGISASAFQSGMDNVANDEGWKLNFRLGGGLFLLSGTLTGITLAYDFISKRCCAKELTDSHAPENRGSSCCTFICCVENETKTEKESAECSSCVTGCSTLTCPSCFMLSCCQGRKHIEKEEQQCGPLCSCCRGISFSCFSLCFTCMIPCLSRKRENIRKERKCACDFCIEIQSSCSPKCLSLPCLIRKQAKSEKDTKTKIERKGCSPCFPKCFNLEGCCKKGSNSETDINKSESKKEDSCTPKCFPIPCLSRKQSSSENNEKINNRNKYLLVKCPTFRFPKCFNSSEPSETKTKHKSSVTKENIPHKCHSCFPKRFSIPITRKRSFPEEDTGDEKTSEHGYKKCTPLSFPAFCYFPCSSNKRQKSENEINKHQTEKGTESDKNRIKGISPLLCCQRLQKPSCLPLKKSSSALQSENETSLGQTEDMISESSNELKPSHSKCKGFTFSRCLTLPNQCLSLNESSLEINNSLNEVVNQEKTSNNQETKNEPTKSNSKRIPLSKCFKFSKTESINSEKSDPEMSSIYMNSTGERSPVQNNEKRQNSYKKSENEKLLCKGLRSCLRLPKRQRFISHETSSEMKLSPDNSTLHGGDIQKDSNDQEIKSTPDQNELQRNALSISNCFNFLTPDKERVEKEFSSEIELIPKKTSIENGTKQNKSQIEVKSESISNTDNSERVNSKEQKSNFRCLYPYSCSSDVNKVSPTSSQLVEISSASGNLSSTSMQSSTISTKPSTSGRIFLPFTCCQASANPSNTRIARDFYTRSDLNKKDNNLIDSEQQHSTDSLKSSFTSKKQSGQKIMDIITDSEKMISSDDIPKFNPSNDSDLSQKQERDLKEKSDDEDSGPTRDPRQISDESTEPIASRSLLLACFKGISKTSGQGTAYEQDLNKNEDKKEKSKQKDETSSNESTVLEHVPIQIVGTTPPARQNFGQTNTKNINENGTLILKKDSELRDGEIFDSSKDSPPQLERPNVGQISPVPEDGPVIISSLRSNKPDTEVGGKSPYPEDEPMKECPRYERAKAPPTKPTYRNKRLEYEANRRKNDLKRLKHDPLDIPETISPSRQQPYVPTSKIVTDTDTVMFNKGSKLKQRETSDSSQNSQNSQKQLDKSDTTVSQKSSSLEDEPVKDCPRFERAIAPPTEPIHRNRRLEFEENRRKTIGRSNET